MAHLIALIAAILSLSFASVQPERMFAAPRPSPVQPQFLLRPDRSGAQSDRSNREISCETK
jgi:hypothetical protein